MSYYDTSSYDTMRVVLRLFSSKRILKLSFTDCCFLVRDYVPAESVNCVLGCLANTIVTYGVYVGRMVNGFYPCVKGSLLDFDTSGRIPDSIFKEASNTFQDSEDLVRHLMIVVSDTLHDLYYTYYRFG